MAAVSELDNYLHRLEDLRNQVKTLIVDLPTEALDWRPTESVTDHASNSLAVLAAHVAGAEHYWIAEVIGGRPSTRDRPAEFATESTSAGELIHLLDQSGRETRAVFATLKAADLDGARQVEGRSVPIRWAILHVIDHTALHLGHMQITYQLWMEGKSKPSPFWHQRLPQPRDEMSC